jgi:hypothetical protein
MGDSLKNLNGSRVERRIHTDTEGGYRAFSQ